ncbi:unnamed protein product [Lasius platythorax]|uniref:Uncharacterized protein n=1 Tax=Lasius platythorax TaxID=488582 RepID=A0AAV2NAG3_9HYME
MRETFIVPYYSALLIKGQTMLGKQVWTNIRGILDFAMCLHILNIYLLDTVAADFNHRCGLQASDTFVNFSV